MAANSAQMGFIILSLFALTGTQLFQIFNLEVFAFQIAVGILLVTYCLKNAFAEEWFSASGRTMGFLYNTVTFVLTSRLITIMTVILLFSQAITLFEFVFVGIAVGVGLAYLVMIHANRLSKFSVKKEYR